MIDNKMFLHLQICQSNFDDHFHSFEINETNETALIESEEIYHYHPLCAFKNLVVGDFRRYVRPYCLISNVF